MAHVVVEYADPALQPPLILRLEPDLLIQQLPQLSSAPPMAGKCATIRNSHKHTPRRDTLIKSLGIMAFIQTCCEGLTCQAVTGSTRTKMCGGSSVPENGTCVENSSHVSIYHIREIPSYMNNVFRWMPRVHHHLFVWVVCALILPTISHALLQE